MVPLKGTNLILLERVLTLSLGSVISWRGNVVPAGPTMSLFELSMSSTVSVGGGGGAAINLLSRLGG